jgi:hypothetical protein
MLAHGQTVRVTALTLARSRARGEGGNNATAARIIQVRAGSGNRGDERDARKPCVRLSSILEVFAPSPFFSHRILSQNQQPNGDVASRTKTLTIRPTFLPTLLVTYDVSFQTHSAATLCRALRAVSEASCGPSWSPSPRLRR